MSFLQRKPPKLSREATDKFLRESVIKDLIRTFGKIQECECCGFVLSKVNPKKTQECCGKPMKIGDH
ncbi:hypothetical protein WKH56_20465 [Priestia sp. SB1]|uniref:hypothetical protein n=1 Tax=Priestia sp. SB1 TaxID=3132359 RepID=UPI003180C737